MNGNQAEFFEKSIYVEKIRVNELIQRYELGKSTVYFRLNKLNIAPFRQDGKSYITGEQLQVMDELHTYLQNRGKIADFVAARIESCNSLPLNEETTTAQSPNEEVIESDETIPDQAVAETVAEKTLTQIYEATDTIAGQVQHRPIYEQPRAERIEEALNDFLFQKLLAISKSG